MTRVSTWRTRFAIRAYISGSLLAVAVILSWITGAEGQAGWLRLRHDLPGLLYTAAALVAGINFFGAGLRAVRSLKLDMNFLMSIAIVAAILIGEPFEAAALGFLFSVAELLERFAVDRGRRSIASLLDETPESATLLTQDGSTVTVAARDLAAGQTIRIRPGDRIPADGRVVAGSSAVAEAAITGESLPKLKQMGDLVYAGTLNHDGSIDVEVTADAARSVLARIVSLVRASEANRAPVEQFVTKFARVYTPIVTVTAALVMFVPPLLWQVNSLEWFVRGLTLLVIACPCALVIATPVTMVSALTSAARHGVLIKGGIHIEALGQMRALAMDKTGTLTGGKLRVDALHVRNESDRELVLRRSVAVESRSQHPIAHAIVAFGNEKGITPEAVVRDFSLVPGMGVRASVDGARVEIGAAELVGQKVADLWVSAASPSGAIRIYFISEDGSAGLFVLRDEARREAAQSVAQLHALGVHPIVMLTGDAEQTAQEIGRETGVDDVRSGLLPEEKVAVMRELLARYHSVGMVGDGVNDAPVLAAASVGIAMGAAGSPAAIEAADVALMGDDVARLPYAVRLARRARRVVRANIAVAIGLKVVLAVGALLGVVSLAVAVLVGDMGASLLVTLNALRVARTR